ncbi:malonyl CoA-ACP transacylase [Longimycelium tulufanense]|uniref:Malonyl CoA-ACP transacylase n=1 Tax=Longimycelium tulufanense TaxID=907463 RepID=A0A8J3CFH3_9PSEU|nr:malonyl CoA-ACP transacylase [Longimycelium tulufanense]GGM57887.1 malonyl CoA-ACP transacylase [Longimycelium tulufanense]
MIAAWVDGTPLRVSEVDRVEHELRARPGSSVLPAHDSSEGRQLRRWLVQLLTAAELVRAEAARRHLAEHDAPPLRAIARERHHLLELGSVVAALLRRHALARAVFDDVTRDVEVGDEEVAAYYARNADVVGAVPFTEARGGILDQLRGAARRRAFVLWLDGQRAHRVRLAAGYEHPGDPRQPDNTHRH